MNANRASAKFNVRHPLSTIESTLLSSLSSRHKKIFTLKDVQDTLKVTYENAKTIVNRLIQKGWLIRLTPGKYLIIPLEAGVNSNYSEPGYVIASHLASPYYIAYGSALNYHGLTDRVPPFIYVATTQRRRDRTILYNSYKFVTIVNQKMFGTTTIMISDTSVKISDPEKTIIDCLDRPEYCGGFEEIAKTLYYDQKKLDTNKLIEYAKKQGNKTILKRLGFLFEKYQDKRSINQLNDLALSEGYSKLDPNKPNKGHHNTRWKLIENIDYMKWDWMQ